MAMWNNQMVSFARTGDTSRSPSVFFKVYLRLASFADLTVQWGVILSGILANMALCQVWNRIIVIWVWINTYRYIFSGMNIHLPAILGFTRYQGFDPSPFVQRGVFIFKVGQDQGLRDT